MLQASEYGQFIDKYEDSTASIALLISRASYSSKQEMRRAQKFKHLSHPPFVYCFSVLESKSVRISRFGYVFRPLRRSLTIYCHNLLSSRAAEDALPCLVCEKQVKLRRRKNWLSYQEIIQHACVHLEKKLFACGKLLFAYIIAIKDICHTAVSSSIFGLCTV